MKRIFFLCLIGFLFAIGANSHVMAVTFKDGKISKDNQLQEPAPKAENKNSGGFLNQLFGGYERRKLLKYYSKLKDSILCYEATRRTKSSASETVEWKWNENPLLNPKNAEPPRISKRSAWVNYELYKRKLDCTTFSRQVLASQPDTNDEIIVNLARWENSRICELSANGLGGWDMNPASQRYVEEAKRRGLTCGVGDYASKQIVSSSVLNKSFVPSKSNGPFRESDYKRCYDPKRNMVYSHSPYSMSCSKNDYRISEIDFNKFSSSEQNLTHPTPEPQTTSADYDKGLSAYNRGDFATALREWIPLAEQGNAFAQNSLGVMYVKGQGVPKDNKEAMRLYRLAAEQGYAKAQVNLGFMYREGQGVPRDNKEALRWYKLAAEQGYAKAQTNLGWMYEKGRGVRRDYSEAARLYKLAAEQGDAWAQTNLGNMYRQGLGIPKENKEAVRLYRLASDQGNVVAQNNLGTMYQKGLGVSKDNKEALRWYRLAADQGYTTAQVNMGFMYRKGQGVPRDDKEALRWYRLAAEQGDTEAEKKLAELGILTDREKDNGVVTSKSPSSSKALDEPTFKAENKITSDTQVPLITITQSDVDGRKGTLTGFAKDNIQIAEVLINGNAVSLGNDGSFEWSGFVPATGKDITVEAIDSAALSSIKVIRLERGQIQQPSGPRFADLDPTIGKRVERNDNALALIVGIADYERTDAPAIYADKDAQYFHDYASLKLGIPDSNIKTMVNDKAEQGDVILAVKDWMIRSSKPGKTDVYVFFAGHGLASQDGEKMYLLPFDGRPRLLDKTAILRDELFQDISSANPRSVTVFLDTCYSGTTRGTDMLIASRPIAIRVLEQNIPDNFTVMTAAAADQTAKPLEEAKHGMFSYFLMKGMEGEADADNDNQITAGELHAYVQQNVVQQSSGSQTPELQGDRERVLVRFQ